MNTFYIVVGILYFAKEGAHQCHRPRCALALGFAIAVTYLAGGVGLVPDNSHPGEEINRILAPSGGKAASGETWRKDGELEHYLEAI